MLISIFILILGWALLAIGRYGWLTGHHPTCRNCGFDLYALPPETARRPECGQNILADHAICIGQRHPIKSAIAAGIVLLLAGIALLAVSALIWWPQFDGSRYKMTATLESESLAADDLTHSRACAELLRRIRAGALSAAQADPLANRLLTRQADPAATWLPAWGDLLQAQHQARLLSDDRWRRYLTQALQVTAQIRPRISTDDPFPFLIACTLRAGTNYEAIRPGKLTPQIIASFAGIASPVHMNPAAIDEIPGPTLWNAVLLPPAGANLPSAPGPHTLELDITMTLTDRAGISAAATQHLSLPFDLLPRGQSSVSMRTTPELAKEMNEAAHYRPPRYMQENPAAGIPLTPPKTALGSVWISGPPIAVAYLVVLRQDGRDWPLARLMVRPNDAANVPLTLTSSPSPPRTGMAEVVCIPDSELAPGTVDVLELFSGEMRWPVTIDAPP